MEEINTTSMIQNQVFAKRWTLMVHGLPFVDTCYNNQPQQGCEDGTQAFAAAVDLTTCLVLDMVVANKLCRKRECDHARQYRRTRLS